MHFWLHGFDWGWLVLLIVWVFVLGVAMWAALKVNWPPVNRH